MSDITALAEAVGVLDAEGDAPIAGDVLACLGAFALPILTLTTGAMVS